MEVQGINKKPYKAPAENPVKQKQECNQMLKQRAKEMSMANLETDEIIEKKELVQEKNFLEKFLQSITIDDKIE